jgi:hypothetical protein
MTIMMDKLEVSKQTGRFTISPGRDIYGELTLAGRKTSLYLHDKEFFDTRSLRKRYVKGVLHDLTKVSLIQCITAGTGSSTRGDDGYHFANVFPHFIVFGDTILAPATRRLQKCILSWMTPRRSFTTLTLSAAFLTRDPL